MYLHRLRHRGKVRTMADWGQWSDKAVGQWLAAMLASAHGWR